MSGEIVRQLDIMQTKGATYLTRFYLKAIALLCYGLIATIARDLVFGILKLLIVFVVSIHNLFI
jgi:hypothetical protein